MLGVIFCVLHAHRRRLGVRVGCCVLFVDCWLLLVVCSKRCLLFVVVCPLVVLLVVFLCLLFVVCRDLLCGSRCVVDLGFC